MNKSNQTSGSLFIAVVISFSLFLMLFVGFTIFGEIFTNWGEERNFSLYLFSKSMIFISVLLYCFSLAPISLVATGFFDLEIAEPTAGYRCIMCAAIGLVAIFLIGGTDFSFSRDIAVILLFLISFVVSSFGARLLLKVLTKLNS